MMRILLTACVAWMVSSCAFSEPRTQTLSPNEEVNPPSLTPPPPGHTQVDPNHSDPVLSPTFAACDLAGGESVNMLWGDNALADPWQNYEHRSAFLGFSPQPGLLAHTGSVSQHPSMDMSNLFRYALDGSAAFSAPHLFRHGIDSNWLVRLEIASQSAQVKWLVTGELLFEAPVSPVPPHLVDTHPDFYAVLTPAAERVVTVTCIRGSQGDAAIVASFELPQGEAGPSVLIEDFHCSFYPQGPLVVPAPDGQGVLLTGSMTSSVVFVDLMTGDSHLAMMPARSHGNTHPGNPGPGPVAPAILDIAIHPSGSMVALSDSDGQLRFRSLPTLMPIERDTETNELQGLFESTIPVGVLPVNQGTYMPSIVSPVDFSPDGRLFAHVSPEGQVLLRDLETLEVRTTLEVPELTEESEEGLAQFVTVNSARRIVFSPDSSAVSVLYTMGPALYGCTDWTITGENQVLQVRIEGPDVLEQGQPGTFTATHFGTQNVHGHQFFVNDVAVTSMSMDRTLTWIPEKAGEFKVTVVIDDGFNEGEESMMFEVVASP